MNTTDTGQLVLALIHSRQSMMPKRLQAPGADASQRQQLLDAATG